MSDRVNRSEGSAPREQQLAPHLLHAYGQHAAPQRPFVLVLCVVGRHGVLPLAYPFLVPTAVPRVDRERAIGVLSAIATSCMVTNRVTMIIVDI